MKRGEDTNAAERTAKLTGGNGKNDVTDMSPVQRKEKTYKQRFTEGFNSTELSKADQNLKSGNHSGETRGQPPGHAAAKIGDSTTQLLGRILINPHVQHSARFSQSLPATPKNNNSTCCRPAAPTAASSPPARLCDCRCSSSSEQSYVTQKQGRCT